MIQFTIDIPCLSMTLGTLLLNTTLVGFAFSLGAAPEFVSPLPFPHTENVEENDVGALSLTLSATDDDSDTPLTMSLAAGAPSEFTLTPGSTTTSGGKSHLEGILSLNTALDYESGTTSYDVPVVIDDGVVTAVTATVTIAVVDVNDETPVLTGGATITESVDEGIMGVTIATFAATDSDAGDTLSFSITGTGASHFSLEALTGVLKTADDDLDYESTTSYTLTLTVTDAASHQDSAVLTIDVNDVNEQPTCSPCYYFDEKNEGSTDGLSVVSVTCSDPDTAAGFGTLQYSIQSGDDTSAKFAIDSASGAVTTSSNELDYETKPRYELIVHAVDNVGNTELTATATVIVKVGDENDHTPSWTTAPADQTIDENAAIGATVYTVAATDDDGTDNTITYTLLSATGDDASNGADLFSVDCVSGAIVVSGNLDRDGGATNYLLTVEAKDSSASVKSVTGTMTVNLNDVNEFEPWFAQRVQDASVTEGAAAGTVVTTVSAVTDDDATSSLTYSFFPSATHAHFKFNSVTPNQIDVKTAIDLESGSGDDTASYDLIVIVIDGGSPSVKTGTTTVVVTVTSTNDVTPTFGTINTESITESTSIGTLVATVTASDTDYGSDGDLTYSKGGGDSSNYFQVDPSTAEVRLQRKIDYDTMGSDKFFEIDIIATDGGSTARSATGTLTVSVTDVSDEMPSCSPTSTTASVAEDTSTGTTVTTVTCTDADSSDTLGFTLCSGNTGSSFAISSSGVITVANALSYDSGTQEYQLSICVTDSTNTVTIPVGIEVTPVNTAPSYGSATSVNKLETLALGTSLGTLPATDNDASPHNVVSYVFDVLSTGEEYFLLDESTAEITLAKSLDYETMQTHKLLVKATDGAGASATGTLSILVLDYNDNAPSCTPSSGAFSVDEGSSGTLVSLSCSDADSGSLGTVTVLSSLTVVPLSSAFSVSGSDILYDNTLDYDGGVTLYTITVTVEDGGSSPKLSTDVVLMVDVQPVNEAGPAFSPTTVSQSLSESVGIDYTVATVTATDTDASTHPHGNLIYSIISGNGDGKFGIKPDTAEVFVASPLDYESGTTSYDLVIKAIEEVGTNSATATLSITLTDANDQTPSCTTEAFSIGVAENVAASGGNPYTVSALTLGCSDDAVDTITYTLSSGDTSVFQMSSSSLQIIDGLDYDAGTREYSVGITVSDGTNSVVVEGTIMVTAVNEGTPAFTSSTLSGTVSEDAAVGITVATVAATDTDSSDTSHGVVTHSFVGTVNDFRIEPTTGKIILASELDREATGSYTIEVEASDGTNSATATITLTVTDINDNSPIFSQNHFTASVAENSATNAGVVTAGATDADDNTNDNNIIKYTIESGNTGSVFAINSGSGAITVAGTVDYETATSYTLSIMAKDRDGAAGYNSATALVTVSVTGVNEADPTFASDPYTVSVDENISPGDLIATVAATDTDSGDNGDIYYAFDPVPTDFNIDSETGKITLKAALDYESASSYSLLVKAHDRGASARSGTATVDITVNDVNDNTPTCTTRAFTKTYREDFDHSTNAASDPVATLSCSDADSGVNGNLVYTITEVNGNAGTGPFTVDTSGSVTVQVSSALDFETDSLYDIVLVVRDNPASAADQLSTTVLITVDVTDVNEAAPDFTGQSASASMAESDPFATAVATITATDTDTAETITYSFATPSNVFEINPATGEIVLKGTAVVASSPYTLSIVGTDSGTVDAAKSSTHTLTVTITDANDLTPTFNPALYTASISESASAGTTVTTVTATDGDTGANGAITYSLSGGNTGTVFAISSSSGVITLSLATLDHDSIALYELEVTATDGGSLSSSATVLVNIQNANDDTPVFTGDPYTFTQAEDIVIGTTVGTVVASDTEGLTFSIASGGDGKFQMDPLSGDIILKAELDRETNTQHTLTIRATDEGSPANSADASVTVNVADANDETPVCSPAIYTPQIAEGSTAGAGVTTVTCTDADDDPADNNDNIVYSISSGNTGTNFQIDSSTGAITVAASPSLDYEATALYNLVILATDQGTSAKTGTAYVDVTITPVNEFTPTFSPSSYSQTVSEDASVGDTITTVTATDDDQGTNGLFTYSIASGNTGSKFKIDPSSGVITLTDLLDYETTTSFTLVVHATDTGSLFGTTNVVVSVTDVNEFSASCGTGVYSTTLSENTADNTQVTGLSVTCTDADGTNNIKYYINSGNTNSAFSLSTAGVLTVNSQAALDRETTPFWEIIVDVEDQVTGSVRTTTIYMDVTLDDVNEQAPQFTPTNTFTANVAESETMGYLVADIDATDSDLGVNSEITYSITGGDTSSSFSINPNTGEVFLDQALDRETTASYTLTITATDGATVPMASTATLSVTVTDVNDNTPVCSSSPYTASVAEDAAINDPVTTVACTDADAAPNSDLTYSLASSDPSTGTSHFTLGASSGVITVTAAGNLDYETTRQYTLLVDVTDGGTPALVATATVYVTITAVNEHDPVIAAVAGGYTASLAEDVAINDQVIDMDATDADYSGQVHGQLRWSIVNGNTGNAFAIDESSGIVQVAAPLDFETLPSYTLTVRASDSLVANGDERTVDETVTVTVTDVNDNDPVFFPVFVSASIVDSSNVGTTVATITTTDSDTVTPSSGHTFTIDSGDPSNHFLMTDNDLLVNAALDAETQAMYTILVKCQDNGTPSLSSTGTVVVNLEFSNDNDPVITAGATDSIDVDEDTNVTTVLYTTAATDVDGGIYGNAGLRYSIVSGDPTGVTFFLDDTSGELSLGSYLDYESTTSYTLVIRASDAEGAGGGRTDDITLTVNVLDVNDNTPVWSISPAIYTKSIPEDSASGTAIKTVAATDADSGVNAQIAYAISGGESTTWFSIDSVTGDIITASTSFDYELKRQYNLLVTATDQGAPPLTSTCQVTVKITDANDNTPAYQAYDFAVSVYENSSTSIVVGEVAATDADASGTVNSQITYSIDASTNTDGYFELGAQTGNSIAVQTLKAVDRETIASHVIKILAVDGGAVALTGTATMTVNIDDINDNPPSITNSPYSADVTEDTAVSTSVITVTATDIDEGLNSMLVYAITGNNVGSAFRIGATTGIIYTNTVLDRETQASYQLQVTVSDRGTPVLTATVVIALNIVDVNDNPPIFPGDYQFYLAENAPLGSAVGIITASDADTGLNGNIQYSLVEVADTDNHFTIDGSTGAILTNSAVLDREVKDIYELVFVATDLGSPALSSSANVRISLSDVNDNTPFFDQSTYTVAIPENVVTGFTVIDLSAGDSDILQNQDLNYTLEGALANEYFQINYITALIIVFKSPDRETHAEFNFYAKATDDGTPPLSGKTLVTVTIQDVNDNFPVFVYDQPTYEVYSAEIEYEDYVDGSTILQASATDADDGDNALIAFSIKFANSLFQIDSASGNLTRTGEYLDPNKVYILTITASDTGLPPKSSDATVRIDTFPGSVVLIQINMSITEEEFWPNKKRFELQLTQILQPDHPDAAVKVYKIVPRRVLTAVTSGKRRLLQDDGQYADYISVYVYALSTGEEYNETMSKSFLTDAELLSYFQSDQNENTPSSFLSGQSFEDFKISTVEDYLTPISSPPWWQTRAGLTVIITCSVLGLILLVIVVFLIVWFCCRSRNRPITPVRPRKQETERIIKKWPHPSVITLTSRKPRESRAENGNNSLVYQDHDIWNERTTPSPAARLAAKKPSTPPPVTRNRQFDGKAYDPGTGRMYEYNTKTNERRWLTTSSQMDTARTGSRGITPPPPTYTAHH